DGLRLRIGDVDRVLLVDVDPARPAELLPFGLIGAVLIENLNAIVLAVADEQPAARVHRQCMRLVELIRARPSFAPRFDQLAILRELEDAIDRRTMAD